MEDNIFDKVHEVDLEKTMKDSYIDYAMSVIASRALPDVRDGLKPVQRRVLYSMIELNNGPDKPHRKCARIVGDTMGKYHPHGDSSIYGALVNMAQEWSTRYPLVDGHGNFGSVDGDGAAAMRYTEARLSKISMEMLADINKDTVDFQPNFDETEREPVVLPSRYPNLLVNGTSGIAVGMATNIPPHNLREVVDAVVKIIDNIIEEQRETTMEEILDIVKGPDFPTGAMILGRRGIEEAYRTGRGKIRVRAVTNIETLPNGKSRIIVTELPYLVNKARLISKIAELVRDKKIDGITDLNDHSSREGMRICIDLRKDANANVVLNLLYKHTQLQDTFGVNMLSLIPNNGSLEPKVLNLKQMLEYYLAHQEDVVTRRTKYDLNKARERAHILEGLLKALDNIDEVIRIIRASQNVQIAKQELMDRFELTDVQAQAIVDMRLRALTGLEREKLEAEYAELEEKIRKFLAILADRNLLLRVVREEILAIRQLAYAAHREGKEVGIIATGETVQFYNYGIVKNIGTRENENTIARNLYRVLREFDEEDVDLIYSESFAMNGIGKAIMNRLEKAAGHMHLQATEITKKQKYRRVIFVSEADSAVGPMAAELLCHQDLEQEYIIESGGLVVLFPEPVNQKAEAIMKSAQMTLENHVSKQFDGSNLQGDTLVLTLNETIKNKVLSDYENVKNVYTINEFVGVSEELPNPYGKPLTAYGECFEILTGLIDKLADKLNSYAKGEE